MDFISRAAMSLAATKSCREWSRIHTQQRPFMQSGLLQKYFTTSFGWRWQASESGCRV